VFLPIRSAQTIEAASSKETAVRSAPRLVANCGRLIGQAGSPPFFASNVRLGGPVPPAVPDAAARRLE
jgi:hypothetical protein